MAAIKFVCKTNNKANHEDIRRRVYLAGGSIVREKLYKDTSTQFEGLFEIMSEGGTLFREVKELGLSVSTTIVN